MSICGLLLVPLLLEHSALCRLLAALFRDGRMRAASGVSFSPREHRRTSLTSPSIFLERMAGNTALTRSSTLFLKAVLRHTRFSMNTPCPKRQKGEGGIHVDETHNYDEIFQTKTKIFYTWNETVKQ